MKGRPPRAVRSPLRRDIAHWFWAAAGVQNEPERGWARFSGSPWELGTSSAATAKRNFSGYATLDRLEIRDASE
jgi:hypothetical protein